MFPALMRYGPKIIAGGAALGYGNFVNNNLNDQNDVLSGEKTAPEGSRLEAMKATQHFPEDTVGYGAHPNIRLIHALGGQFGQAKIGSVFTDPETQKHMGNPIGSPSNKHVANVEHDYWMNTLFHPNSLNDFAGGVAGTMAPPFLRAFLQSKANDVRKFSNKINV